jgi:hypothetical protein
MKRFLTFYGDIYYPNGGIDDLIGDFETIDEAKTTLINKHKQQHPNDINWGYAWGYVYDTKTQTKIYQHYD